MQVFCDIICTTNNLMKASSSSYLVPEKQPLFLIIDNHKIAISFLTECPCLVHRHRWVLRYIILVTSEYNPAILCFIINLNKEKKKWFKVSSFCFTHQCDHKIIFESGLLEVKDLPVAVIFTSFGVFPKEKAKQLAVN